VNSCRNNVVSSTCTWDRLGGNTELSLVCGVVISTLQTMRGRYRSASFLNKLEIMLACNEPAPGLQAGVGWGSSGDWEVGCGCSGDAGSLYPLAHAGWVPRLQCTVLAGMPQHGFACLLLSESKMYYLLLLFLYALHEVETKIRYKLRVHQSLLT